MSKKIAPCLGSDNPRLKHDIITNALVNIEIEMFIGEIKL